MKTIELSRLIIVLIPALLVVILQWRWAQKGSTTLYAIARMAIQLILIGYALTYIFRSENPWLILSILTVMLVASSWIALRPIESSHHLLFWDALFATLIVNASLLLLITVGVLQTDPWFTPNIVIPLAGMVFAAGMNAISLFGERYFAELRKSPDELAARNAAYQATLIPTINSLFAVGLVSLPGMMTGQILSGVSPLIAVRYQIMIMLMLLASSGLTAALFYTFMQNRIKREKGL